MSEVPKAPKIKDIDGPIQMYWLRGTKQDCIDLAGAVIYWRRIAESEREKREAMERQVQNLMNPCSRGS